MAGLTPGQSPPDPFPPGEYPVVVIGSGPGAIQASASLRAVGVDHAVISADPSPGGMFRRWPFFQRLLSWTKPHAPVPRGSRAYERYDWNSLLSEDPASRALQPGLMDGSSYFPSRPEMEANLALFAERAGVVIRYGCRWTATARVETAGRRRLRGRHDRRSLPLPGPDRRRRRRGAVHPARPGHGVHPPLRRGAPGRGLRRPPHPAHRQAELRLRARDRAAAVGAPDHPHVAVPGAPVGRDQDAGRRPGALRPAVRGPRAGRRGQRPGRGRSTGSSGPTTAA